jgi:catechol 2,3-dioxygenase-like lactoylglutathione lyase family enzyme
MEINGVAHIILRVSRFEQCAAFYDALMPRLGLEVVYRSDRYVYQLVRGRRLPARGDAGGQERGLTPTDRAGLTDPEATCGRRPRTASVPSFPCSKPTSQTPMILVCFSPTWDRGEHVPSRLHRAPGASRALRKTRRFGTLGGRLSRGTAKTVRSRARGVPVAASRRWGEGLRRSPCP